MSPEAASVEQTPGVDTVFPLRIDRSETFKIRRRFLNLNRLRLQHIHEALPSHQRIFFELLSLLFHTNHPLMPGYVDKECPCGVSDYNPGKRALRKAASVARSFSMRKGVLRRVDIHAIYLIGSSGTVAQSSGSDFDIWLCHSPELSTERVDQLRKKGEAIESWARGLGLEVHFFVMSADHFRDSGAEELSSESSGTAQRYLLLDEFYRTGLLVAGRAPLWWLVPPEMENDYADFVATMVQHRFIKPQDYLDFGAVTRVTPAEFFGATLWQLSKAISAPYKSLLKILLLESYATRYPELDLLSTRFKSAIYAAETRIEKLDPYVLLYEKVEEHLKARDDTERLELARRCLYFKVNKSFDEIRKPREWRGEVMAELSRAWGWGQGTLRVLDARNTWKVDRVLEERKALVSALTHSYKSLSLFAREHGAVTEVSERDMTILGRKLFIAFEHKAGKIDIVNHGVSSDLSESHLYIHHVTPDEGKEYWLAYRSPRQTDGAPRTPLKRGWTILELMVWCHFNGLLTSNTRVIMEVEAEDTATGRDAEAMSAHLRKHFPEQMASTPSVHALTTNARLVAAATFINFGSQPLSEHARRGTFVTSDRSDALSYSGWHENLIHGLDYLVVTSWGEISTHKYSGMDGLMSCLCAHLVWLSRRDDDAMPKVSHCCSPRHGETISRRISTLLTSVSNWFSDLDLSPCRRYIIRGGDQFYALLSSNGVPSHDFSGTYAELLRHLERPNSSFTTTSFDPHARIEALPDRVFAANQEGILQFFYLLDGEHASIYILDENGALFTDSLRYVTEKSLLSHFSQFFESVEFRQNASMHADPRALRASGASGSQSELIEQTMEMFPMRVQFYQVVAKGSKAAELRRIDYKRFAQGSAFFNVKVMGEVVDGETEFTVYCNSTEFSTREHGTRLFERVTEHILARRKSTELYPIYITDIDLSWLPAEHRMGGELHTIHYLQYKKRIEHKLNYVLDKQAALPEAGALA